MFFAQQLSKWWQLYGMLLDHFFEYRAAARASTSIPVGVTNTVTVLVVWRGLNCNVRRNVITPTSVQVCKPVLMREKWLWNKGNVHATVVRWPAKVGWASVIQYGHIILNWKIDQQLSFLISARDSLYGIVGVEDVRKYTWCRLFVENVIQSTFLICWMRGKFGSY